MSARRHALMANHNRCWIWGRNLVLETLRAGHWPVIELLYSDRCDVQTRGEVLSLASNSNIPATAETDQNISRQCRSEEHQGLAARMPLFPYRQLADILDQMTENPVLVMLDRVQDSFNFGAIIRSAEVLGIDGIIIGTREQAPVNSQVARSSAGAVNYVPIAQTDDLVKTVEILRERNFQIIGTSDRASATIFQPDFRKPTLLLIGNEGGGIQPALEALCTLFVRIPVSGEVSSLNAAVSAGILFYEVMRQRQARP